MSKHTANMFITGPDVIKSVTGESVTTEDLGGATVHNRTSGVAHFIGADDADCIAQIRNLLSYLPSNNAEEAPVYGCTDDLNRLCPELDTIVPDNPNQA